MNWRPWIVACAALVLGGVSYRAAMAWVRPLVSERIILPLPLAMFPIVAEDWVGEDRPLSPEVERIAGNDDYLNRLYVNHATGEWANMYVAYSGRPRTMVGHRPQVCYTGAGWIHDSTEAQRIALEDGGTLPCLVHRFHQVPPNAGDTVVLNYYVLNGVPTNDEGRFSGVGWRLPNIGGDPAWYVAQVQISSRSEASARRLAALTFGEVLARLPDASGRIRASGRD